MRTRSRDNCHREILVSCFRSEDLTSLCLSHFAVNEMLLGSADSSEFDEIALQLKNLVVDSDNYDVVVDETILACLKGIEGADRTNMIKAITNELIGLVESALSNWFSCRVTVMRYPQSSFRK